MTGASAMRAKIVRVLIEQGESGAYFATSPDLKGFLVSKMTIEAVHQDIPRAISELFAVCGVPVVVTPADDDSEYGHPWVAIPTAIMQQQTATA